MTLEETTQSGNKNKTGEKKPGDKTPEGKSTEGKSTESKGTEGTEARSTEDKRTEDKRTEASTAKDREDKIPEGKSTRAIEKVTARAPSQMWLWLAGAGVAGSLALFLTGRRQEGIFVGLWPLTFLVMGNYNKIVKSIEEREPGR